MCAITIVEIMEVCFAISHESQVLSPRYDMDACVATLFGGGGSGLELRVGSSEKLDPTHNTIPKIFCLT